MNSNDKIVLKDSTEIVLESSQGIGTLNVHADTISDACSLWESFTEENLKQLTVKNSDGLTIGKYQDMVLDHMEVRKRAVGLLLVTFSLREKSAIELLEERISVMESGQKAQDEVIRTHNEAIGDLGQAVSDMAEGGEQ